MPKVLVERDGAVRTVTLNRPEKRNALDHEMLDELEAAFPPQPPGEERVAVLRAAGPVFCAGMDLAQRSENLGRPTPIVAALRAIESFPLPVVAVVRGHAIAGGNEIALHCDFVAASTQARFGMSLAQVGLAPNWFLAKKIMEKGGPVAAREMLLLGDPLPARRMYDLGMIARVAEPEELEAEATKLVDRLATNAPLAVRIMKRTLVRLMDFRDAVPHDDLDDEVRRVSASDDAREGIAARLARRAPAFRGT
ncbi:MAG: enoyl-CoA hydratase/isomerase family protein [Immundisolibacterales bacterium]|nr:enoyl-CoA hydratase/isomerase family protein [Immundisolibacterales bacterium]